MSGISIEAILRKEQRMKVARGAEERGDRVFSEIRTELDAQALILNLEPQAYRSLLEHPELYKKFLEIKSAEKTETTTKKNGPGELNPKRTFVESKTTGRRIETTGWDPKFKWFSKLADDDQMILPID